MAKKLYGDSSGKGHSCNYLKSNARVGFDPGLYGKRMSKSDLYHLKAFPSCNIHEVFFHIWMNTGNQHISARMCSD